MVDPDQLNPLLRSYHLTALGRCQLSDEDGLTGTLILLGPDEPAFWDNFTQSPEYGDTSPDPLDRWSRRVVTEIAKQIGGIALFPFGGPPYLPFYTWAMRTGRFWPSPIGFLVHDTMGLFASFRGAVLLPDAMEPEPASVKPCDSCIGHPCKTACPVGAFSHGYDVAACKTHVNSPRGRDCMAEGCRARRACPVGQGNRLPAQAAFHMKAFV